MTNDIDQRIGSHIRSLRLAASLTPGKVARALGLTVADYEAREAGTARFSAFHLYDLGQLFGCSVGDFFGGAARPQTQRKSAG